MYTEKTFVIILPLHGLVVVSEKVPGFCASFPGQSPSPYKEIRGSK